MTRSHQQLKSPSVQASPKYQILTCTHLHIIHIITMFTEFHQIHEFTKSHVQLRHNTPSIQMHGMF